MDRYRQHLQDGKILDYYDVSGCYPLLPAGYAIWEAIQTFLNSEFKKLDVDNIYFPLFVTEKNLQVEKSHIDGFKTEVAWVTKAGSSDLSEPIAVRPTSECIFYPIFSKLVRSYQS